jgi:hypothetical protein
MLVVEPETCASYCRICRSAVARGLGLFHCPGLMIGCPVAASTSTVPPGPVPEASPSSTSLYIRKLISDW